MAIFEFEQEWANVLRPLSNQPLENFIKELAVLELYRRRMISSGKAAELLNMERIEFIHYASRLGIPFLDMSEAELSEELGRLR
ncbi:MAG: UPF0175 family protein [Chloroflexi bacterium]|nr:MAG: UPF0175 family protein [Chloroflexota bacterium]